MKIGLIGFSTRNYIPYIEYYENIFKSNNISYECIFWDRFNNDNTKKKNLTNIQYMWFVNLE